MYILISAVKNIRRYIGRYTLFGTLMLIVLCIGTTVNLSRENLETKFQEKMTKYGGTVIVKRDKMQKLTQLQLSPVAELPQVDQIQYYRYYFSIHHNAISIDNITCHVDTVFPEDIKQLNQIQKSLRRVMLNDLELSTPQFMVIGIDFSLDPAVNTYTQDQFLAEGRFPQADNEACLNLEYVEALGLTDVTLGSTLQLTFDDKTYEYTIVGFHKAITQSSMTLTFESIRCPVVLTFSAAEQLRTNGTLEDYYDQEADGALGSSLQFSVKSAYDSQILLKSHTLYQSFAQALEELSLKTKVPYYPTLAYADANRLVSAYESTTQICTFFLTAVIAISAVVILIMTALAMHERRYEIGVLLSVGMSKPRIALLFAVENLVFTLGVTILAYVVGLAAAPFAADKLLEGVVTVSRAAAALPVAARMLALAVGLSLPASLISSLAILRYKPMSILRSRS